MPRHIFTAIRIGQEIAKKFGPLAKAEYKIYRGVGYNRRQAGTLVVSTNIGAGAKYLSQGEDELDDGQIPKEFNGSKAYSKNQTRSGQRSYSSKGNYSKSAACARCRRAGSRNRYRRSNRF